VPRVFGHRLSISAAIGITVVVVNLAAALTAPWIAPHGEADSIGPVWAAPSAHYWLGLDNLGRDILSRILFGARTTISIAFIASLFSFVIGTCTGFAAAVLGGAVDALLSGLVNVTMAIPTLIFSLVILSIFGTSVPVLILTIAVLDSTRVFRLSRALGANISVMEYVEAARMRGESLWWIMRREILPNALPPLVAEFGLRFCFVFLFMAALSFLGIGIQPPWADWGGMVRDNAQAINFGGLAALFPAIAIAQLAIGINLLVDWFIAVHGRLGQHET
jgi:peptide/nickel transport system permease protein